jgi:hypothetical protein
MPARTSARHRPDPATLNTDERFRSRRDVLRRLPESAQPLFRPDNHTYTQPDPGFVYKLLVMGLLEGRTVTDGTPIQAVIRLGSTTGTPIATGFSTSESYVGVVL